MAPAPIRGKGGEGGSGNGRRQGRLLNLVGGGRGGGGNETSKMPLHQLFEVVVKVT